MSNSDLPVYTSLLNYKCPLCSEVINADDYRSHILSDIIRGLYCILLALLQLSGMLIMLIIVSIPGCITNYFIGVLDESFIDRVTRGLVTTMIDFCIIIGIVSILTGLYYCTLCMYGNCLSLQFWIDAWDVIKAPYDNLMNPEIVTPEEE